MVDNSNYDQVSVTRNASTDLAWDYSAHEASPLLRGTAQSMYRAKKKLSADQLDYLIENLDEVTRVLKSQTDSRPTQQKCTKFNIFICSIPLVFSIVHVVAVIVDSILNSQKHYTSYAAFSINSFLLLIFLGNKGFIFRSHTPTLKSLVISLTLITSHFASIYSITHSNEASVAYWYIYLQSLHASISVSTLNYYGQLSQENFWVSLLLNIQMILALMHLVLLLACLSKWFIRKSSNNDNISASNEEEADDDDTESYQASFGGRVNHG